MTRMTRTLSIAMAAALAPFGATFAGDVQINGRFVSTVPTGTPPLVVSSTTRVDGLNAHFLGGFSAGDFLVAPDNVLVVGQQAGDFTSVSDALGSITDAAVDNQYLVLVGPGVFEEKDLVLVPSFVHLRGSGPETTVVTSSRSAAAPSNAAATLELAEASRVSDITILNTGTGTGTYGLAILTTLTSRETALDNVVAEAIGSGTDAARYGIYLNDAAPTIRDSTFKGSGAITGLGTAVNAGLGSVNISAGFPQALILRSIFLGGPTSTVRNCNDNTGTGFGMLLSESTPDIRDSHICGGHRAVALLENGQVLIQGSEIRVSATTGAFLFEIRDIGFISVATSAIQYTGNKFTGGGINLRCVHNHDWGGFTPLTDGTAVATACN